MSHWAEIDSNNIVIRVTVGDNNDPAGDEGYQWLIDNIGGIWVKTSYNRNIRKNFAGIGYTYDEARDAFIPPKPFNSWILNEETCKWQAPTPYPSGDSMYQWVEDDLNWQLVEGV
jgi:hypothetical protein